MYFGEELFILLCREQAVLKIVSGMFFFPPFLIQESDLKMSSSVKSAPGLQ